MFGFRVDMDSVENYIPLCTIQDVNKYDTQNADILPNSRDLCFQMCNGNHPQLDKYHSLVICGWKDSTYKIFDLALIQIGGSLIC